MEGRTPVPWAEGLAWVLALTLAALVLAGLHYRTRDPDSRLHADLAEKLAARPMREWIAPEWGGAWYRQGLYREHPAGILWPPALAARLGYPAQQAPYLWNAVYQALTLMALVRFAQLLIEPGAARSLAFVVQLIPIAFTYRIRANHEQVVLLALVLALWGTERSLRRPAWAVLTAIAVVGLALVKGIFVVFVPVACALWLLLRRPTADGRAFARAGLGLALAVGSLVPLVALYEWSYHGVTGQAFLAPYLHQQLGVAAAEHSDALVLQKAYNLVWYLARVLFFPLPWSIVLLALIVRQGRAGWRRVGGLGRAGIAFTLAMTALYVGAFSLSDRKADRYIFPVYFLIAAAGSLAAQRSWRRCRAVSEWLERWGGVGPVVVWVLVFALHLSGGWLHLPRVKVWPSD